MKIAILDRNPEIADDKMVFKRSWMPASNPSSYKTNRYIWSPEVSTAYYLMKNAKFDVELIQWENITDYKKMDSYDFVYIFNHGLSDIVPFWKNKSDSYVRGWKRLGNRVWPNYKLANFVLDKCKYYKYLNTQGIPTAETYCVKTNKELHEIVTKIKSNKLSKVFVKPVGGNSGTNTSSHSTPFKKLQPEIKKLLNSKKYPKIVVQRFMNFSTEDSPEFKCVFIGHELQYVVKTHILGHFLGVIRPNDKSQQLKDILKICKKVIKAFEEKFGKLVICRVDVAYDKQHQRYFLNELEHAGGTYGDDLIHYNKLFSTREWKFDSNLGKEIIKHVSSMKHNVSLKL